jgi:hypothetical protein
LVAIATWLLRIWWVCHIPASSYLHVQK